MKKRYGLDSIIGKKSSLRFPRLVSNIKTDTVSAILPANNATAEPPFSTALTMKKGDPLDTCDQFNEDSYEYELDFPIRVDITLSGPIVKIDVKTPTIFSLTNIVYDLDDFLIENFRASVLDISLNHANFALVKLNTNEDFFLSELLANIKSIYSNLLSYNCRRKRDKSALALLLKPRKKRYLAKRKITNSNQRSNHRRYLHFLLKTNRASKRHHLSLRFDRMDTFYDIYEDWDEFHDEYYKDLYLNIHDHLIQWTSLAELFLFELNSLSNLCHYQQNICFTESLPRVIESFETGSDFDSNLSLAFKLETIQGEEDVCN